MERKHSALLKQPGLEDEHKGRLWRRSRERGARRYQERDSCPLPNQQETDCPTNINALILLMIDRIQNIQIITSCGA